MKKKMFLVAAFAALMVAARADGQEGFLAGHRQVMDRLGAVTDEVLSSIPQRSTEELEDFSVEWVERSGKVVYDLAEIYESYRDTVDEETYAECAADLLTWYVESAMSVASALFQRSLSEWRER